MHSKKQAVFIGGASRSGTTMFGAWLAQYAGYLATPESQFKTDLMLLSEADARKNYRELLRRNFRLRLWELDAIPTWDDSMSVDEYLFAIVDLYGKKMGATSWDTWIDHTPSNLKHSLTLNQTFPRCKFIHIIRDGRAVANSVLKLAWGPGNIIQAASWWAEQICMGLAAELAIPEKIIRVKYEEILREESQTIANLHEFLGLRVEQRGRTQKPFSVPKYTYDQHKHVGRPFEAKIASAWRESLSERDIEIFEFLTGDLLALLGYPLLFDGKARPPRRLERWARGEWPDLKPVTLYRRYQHHRRKRKAFT